MLGEKLSFDSYPYYYGEKSYIKGLKPLEKPTYQDEVIYKSLDNLNHEFNGRIIGGCLDVLVSLCGTKFDNVTNFIEKYKDDGIIWYFDICDLNSVGTYRALFQLENANWFKYVKGFIIGRTLSKIEPLGYQFIDAYKDVLAKYNVPVIYDFDISHVKPSLPVINGAIANVSFKDSKGNITYILK